jgi:hypothetical protein
MNIINLLQSPEQHIKLMMFSVNYINSRLETFYNTEAEKIDIQRNKEYLELMLLREDIITNINPDQLVIINEALDKANTALANHNQ